VFVSGLAPTGVAVDSSGNAFFTAFGFAVAELPSATGSPVFFAGNQNLNNGYSGDNGPPLSAQMNFPVGVAVDTSGNLYIADNGNNVVRKVAGGMITTVAGTGVPSYSGDGGLATSAKLNQPWGVVVDANGNLYISDSGNSVVRKVTGGIIS